MYTDEDQKLFDSFREKLRAQIHAEYKQQIIDQAEENAQLKIDLRELDELKADARNAKTQYENALKNAKVEAEYALKDLKAKELLDIMGTPKYTVESRFVQGEKCNKCNDDRMLEYTLPRGSTGFERCECSDRIREHYAQERIVAEMYLNTKNHTKVWYRAQDNYNRTIEGVILYSAENLDPDTVIENIRRVGFDTKEDAEKYAKIMTQLDIDRKTV